MRSQNYYEILGISRYASPDEIRNAYELSKLTFTQNSLATYSLFSEEENEEILELISKAYETLLNPEMRREYDTFLDSGGQGSHHAWEARRPPPAQTRMPGGAPPRPAPESAGADMPHAPARPSSGAAPHPGAPRRETPGREPSQRELPFREPGAREPAPREAQAREIPVREAPARDPVPAREGAPRETPAQREATAPREAPMREPHREAPAAPAPAREAAEAKPKPAPPAAPAAPRQTEADRFVASLQSYTGETFRRVREMRGVSIFEMCSQTKIRQTYVEYIEAENFAGLPAPVYIRGFVKLMASALGLPPEEAAADYMSRYRAGKRA